MKKILILAAMVFVLAGCVEGMPNFIKESHSDFDNITEYHLEPGYVYGDSLWDVFSLGAVWRTNFGDRMLFLAKIPASAVGIKSKEGLQINIDGEIAKLSSADVITDIDVNIIAGNVIGDSSKAFVGTRALMDKMLAAESVKIRLYTSNGHMDGDFKADKRESAIRGFRELAERLPQVSGS